MTTKVEIETQETEQPEYQVIKQALAPKLNPRFPGKIGYELGIQEGSKQAAVRLTSNTGGGRFSKDWILFSDIETILTEQPNDKPFRAKLLKALWYRGSANNSGFLACVLKDLALINLTENSYFDYVVTDKVKSKIDRLIKDESSSSNKLKAKSSAKIPPVTPTK